MQNEKRVLVSLSVSNEPLHDASFHRIVQIYGHIGHMRTAFHLYEYGRVLSDDLNERTIVSKCYNGMAFVPCEYECGELIHPND